MKFSLARPAAMISRPTALAREMSEPTSSPSHKCAQRAELVPPRVHYIQFGSRFRTISQHMMEEDGMRFPGIRSPQQDDIGVFEFRGRSSSRRQPRTLPPDRRH